MKKTKKIWKKKIKPMEVTCENEIPDSNSLKPFEFEQKTNIGDINSRSSDNEEEGAEAVVWRCSAAGSVEKMFLEISQNSQENTCARVPFLRTAFLKNFSRQMPLSHAFSTEFCKFLRTSFW